jgi:hypothetical protein
MIVRFDVGEGFVAFDCGKLGQCVNVRCVSPNSEGIRIGSGHLAVGKAALPLDCNFVITGVIGRETECDAALLFFINCSVGWLLRFNLARRWG